jgi:hypothetical protein
MTSLSSVAQDCQLLVAEPEQEPSEQEEHYDGEADD